MAVPKKSKMTIIRKKLSEQIIWQNWFKFVAKG